MRDIGKYLGKTIYAISMLDLHDLAIKIGWEMEFEVREEKILLGTTLEEIIVTLVKYEITDGDKLKEK